MLCGQALVAIAWAITLLNGDSVDAAVWRVPVQRHLHTTTCGAASYPHAEPLSAWGLSDARSAKHANVWTPSFPEDPEYATDDIDFDNIIYGFYAADIMFGTPPQPISLVMGLGSTDFYVLNHKLGTHAYYDHTKSSTYTANGTRINMGEHTTYEVQGFVSSDHITIPGAASGHGGLHVRGLSFVEMESPDSFLEELPPRFDGSIGLGARAQNITGTPSIMQLMITQGLLDQPVVGIHLDSKKAHLTFGGFDAQYTEKDITYFTETREEKYGWWVPVTGVHVNGEVIVDKSARAIITEVLDFIAGPADQVDALARAVGAENYAIPCEGPGPDITITMGAFEVLLTKADYAIPHKGGFCLFAFLPAPSSLNLTHWMLGRPFVERVYMVQDYGKMDSDERLGLAHLKSE